MQYNQTKKQTKKKVLVTAVAPLGFPLFKKSTILFLSF